MGLIAILCAFNCAVYSSCMISLQGEMHTLPAAVMDIALHITINTNKNIIPKLFLLHEMHRAFPPCNAFHHHHSTAIDPCFFGEGNGMVQGTPTGDQSTSHFEATQYSK
jgi:hypothetical protein